MELLEARHYEEAQALFDSVNEPLRQFPSASISDQAGRAREEGVDGGDGSPRGGFAPPSKPLDEQELDELRELVRGFGWPVA